MCRIRDTQPAVKPVLGRLISSLVLLSACTGDGTLVIQVRSDLVPGREFASVDVTVTEFDGAAELRFERAARDDRDWGQGVRVAETDLSAGRYRVVVGAVDQSGGVVVERPLVFELPGDELRVLTVLLTRDCRGVECPLAGDDVAEAACLAGRCVDPECAEETPERCGAPACGSAADCTGDPVASCAMRECTASGACIERLDHAVCGDERGCSATDGCVSLDPGVLTLPGPPGHLHLSVLATPFQILRLQIRDGALTENVSAALDAHFPRDENGDRASGMSRNGEWLSATVDRSGCTACLLVAPLADLSAGELIPAATSSTGTFPSNDGSMVVYIEGNYLGIGVLTRDASGWTAPRSLTAGLPYLAYRWPTISDDNSRVLFMCGDDVEGTDAGICEMGIDGTGLVEWLPPGSPWTRANWASWEVGEGAIIFQAELDSAKELFRLTSAGAMPELAYPALSGEYVIPCPLADGGVIARRADQAVVVSAEGVERFALPFTRPRGYYDFFIDGCGGD